MFKFKKLIHIKKENKKEVARRIDDTVDQRMHEQVRMVLQNNYQTIIKNA